MEDYKEKYEKLHKKTLASLQQMVSEGKITEETARSICADFVKESEDEKIRNEIIRFVKSHDGQSVPLDKYESWVEWLERQGEEKPTAYFYCKCGGVMSLCSDCKRNHLNSKYKTEEIETWMVPTLRCTKQCSSYIQQKPAGWSEEDEKHYQGCLNLMKLSLDTKPYPYYNDYLWLKSLKERMKGE